MMNDLHEQRLWNAHFVSMIAHELRTPLTSIISFAQVIGDESEHISKEEQVHYLEMIEKEGKRSTLFINELTEIMKLETGNIFTFSGFYLEDVIKKLLDRSGVHHDATLQYQQHSQLCRLRADYSLIETAMSILLTSLRSKCTGSLTITLEQKAGIIQGMLSGKESTFTEREIHQLFDISAQLTISRTGIPLQTRPIYAAAVVRGHNGNIWISSIPENGVLISFELPCG